MAKRQTQKGVRPLFAFAFLRCIPEMFRADLVDYKDSGYDRGHLVASANQRETALQNSETFLLSNALQRVGLIGKSGRR